MLVKWEKYEFVVDPEIDFLMLAGCYEYGANCYNCYDRVLDSCIIDEVDIESILEEGEVLK